MKTCKKRPFKDELRDEVDAARVPGITPQQTGRSEYYAAPSTVFRYRLHGVLRAAWIKPARLGQGWRNRQAIEGDECNEKSSHAFTSRTRRMRRNWSLRSRKFSKAAPGCGRMSKRCGTSLSEA